MLSWTSFSRLCAPMTGATFPLERNCEIYDSYENTSPMDCTVTGRWRCRNCSCETRAAKRVMQYRTRMWTIAIEAPRITSATKCINTTIRRALVYYQTTAIYRCSFANGCITPVNELLVPTGFEHTKHYFTPEGAFSPHNSHVWTRLILLFTSHLAIKSRCYSWYPRTHCSEHKSASWQADCL